MASRVVVHVETDGTRCVITGSDPAFESADDAGADLIVAAPGGTMKVVYTNSSGDRFDMWVRRADADMTVSELVDSWELHLDGTLYTGHYWVNSPKPASGAEKIEVGLNQLQGDFLLEPGLYVVGVASAPEEAWMWRTSDAVAASLVAVTSV